MKKEYSKTLKSLFKSALKTNIPSASLWKQKSDFIFPGEIVFSFGDFEKAMAFIILVPNAKDDKFTVEMAWSNKRKFPELSVRPNDLLIKAEIAKEYSIRLPNLIAGKSEFWSILRPNYTSSLEEVLANMKKPTAEESIATLKPLVEDCVAEIIEFGIPFVTKILARKFTFPD